MSSATINGVDLHYEDTGGDHPAVVFSHGFLLDHEMFDAQIGALAADWRCISWDQRGHGGTDAPGPFSFWDSAGDLVALLDHLGIERAAFVGMSQGGFVALRVALQAPARSWALAFIDSQAGPEDPSRVPMYDALFTRWTTEGPSEEVAAIVAGMIIGPFDASNWIAKWMARDPASIAHPYRTLVDRDDITDRLGEIGTPGIVIHGEGDMAISVDQARALCEGLPNCSELVVVPGAAHASNLSHPAEVNDALAAFLRAHGPQS